MNAGGKKGETMREVVVAFVIGVMSLAVGAPAQAQEMKAVKIENATWYWVHHVKFEPGKMDQALEMIERYFAPASVDAATPGPKLALVNATGEWDLTLIWELTGGLTDMEWKISPNDVKWFSSMAKLTGGQDQAKQLLERYEGMVVRSSSQLARGWMPESAQKQQEAVTTR
jgi:hypothetical protein